MSQFQGQEINQTGVPYMGALNQGMNMINPNQYGQMINAVNQPANIGIGMNALEQKITESNNIYIINNKKIKNIERHRRSKHEQEGRDFLCSCGKSFLSQPALNNHKKTKHPELLEGQPKRGRGRPRKYPPKTMGDFENTKYDSFFNNTPRNPEEGKTIDMKNVVNDVFNFIYKGNYSNKLFSNPKSYEENPILKNLYENAEVSTNEKNKKTCNEVFYEYLHYFKDKTNEKYFKLLLKFILLFRECYDISKTKESNQEEKKPVTGNLSPEGLPDLCNEFYGEFMEPNNFFDLDENVEKDEIIEIIQHFCIWLFKNEYTKSKLSLAG